MPAVCNTPRTHARVRVSLPGNGERFGTKGHDLAKDQWKTRLPRFEPPPSLDLMWLVSCIIYSICMVTHCYLYYGCKFFTVLSIEWNLFEGYLDDPRNTDNAWLEVIAKNYHDDDNTLTTEGPVSPQHGFKVPLLLFMLLCYYLMI